MRIQLKKFKTMSKIVLKSSKSGRVMLKIGFKNLWASWMIESTQLLMSSLQLQQFKLPPTLELTSLHLVPFSPWLSLDSLLLWTKRRSRKTMKRDSLQAILMMRPSDLRVKISTLHCLTVQISIHHSKTFCVRYSLIALYQRSISQFAYSILKTRYKISLNLQLQLLLHLFK